MGELSIEDRQRFQDWLRAAPEHAEAYEQTCKLWALLEAPSARRTSKPRLAAAWCFALLLIEGAPQLPTYYPNWRSDYHTAAGERFNLVLADGSRLILNTDSAIALQFSAQQRRIELLRGEAYFEVAPNKARLFVVAGGGAEAQAVGTVFGVRRQDNDMQVVVGEGVVAVRGGEAAAMLPAGRQSDYRHGRLEAVQTVKTEDALLAARASGVQSPTDGASA